MKEDKFRGVPPNIEFLEYHDIFLFMYRREGDPTFLEMSRLFRKAAHKLYRVMLKMEMSPKNLKFLNLV